MSERAAIKQAISFYFGSCFSVPLLSSFLWLILQIYDWQNWLFISFMKEIKYHIVIYLFYRRKTLMKLKRVMWKWQCHDCNGVLKLLWVDRSFRPYCIYKELMQWQNSTQSKATFSLSYFYVTKSSSVFFLCQRFMLVWSWISVFFFSFV